ncbi:cyclin-D5-3-like [Andrographis paniculata]|uniref:cyclin-D5-3-like n=1 Tax=Andrographis paniculata TaxID=175694 RepID=UPI0021E7C7DB|nr:cyclin-D5-3-like [Andrographis paniculata]
METSRNVAEEEEEEEEENYDEDSIKMFLEKESRARNLGLRIRGDVIPHPDWVLRARLDGISYILKTRDRLKLRSQTAYASVTYLDRFLARRRSLDEEKQWVVRLLCISCLSIAAKMVEMKVPRLSEFCCEGYTFGSKIIQRMEVLVLNTLEWEIGLVSPFHYIQFFARKFLENTPRNSDAIYRAVDVILGTMRDVKIMCHRPSVVAAAATLIEFDQFLKRDAIEHTLRSFLISSLPFQIEEIMGCYYQIQQDLLQSDHGISSSSSTAAAIGKRKRLVFDHENDDGKKRKP